MASKRRLVISTSLDGKPCVTYYRREFSSNPHTAHFISITGESAARLEEVIMSMDNRWNIITSYRMSIAFEEKSDE